jgi:hypothetical protein
MKTNGHLLFWAFFVLGKTPNEKTPTIFRKIIEKSYANITSTIISGFTASSGKIKNPISFCKFYFQKMKNGQK